MCPHCGSNSWQNNWGLGNARCADCGREFNVTFTPDLPIPVGTPVEEPLPQPTDDPA